MVSDINIWAAEETSPSVTLRGHCDNVTALLNWQNKVIVSADAGGRILTWNPETGLANRPSCTNQKFKIGVAALASNSTRVFASS
jgi:WD40 repeat protein